MVGCVARELANSGRKQWNGPCTTKLGGVTMHQGAFLGANWTVRRKVSRRQVAAPIRGPQWNVQVVRGKVTTRCLWNACKALTIGLFLMLLGCVMATVGYYADQLSVVQEVRGNLTVRVKNESRGFHLNNLSYAGPIVMGVGGFIVVASCVMTFEARDSAAKVVPARFKFNSSQHQKASPVSAKQPSQRSDSGRRSTSCQTKWDNTLGLYRVASGKSGEGGGVGPPGSSEVVNRRALTAAFVQFSRALQNRQPSTESSSSQKRLSVQIAASMNKSPSAPNLTAENGAPPLRPISSPTRHQRRPSKTSPRSRMKPSRNSLHPAGGGCALLSPYLLQRQALSMDNPAYGGCGCYSPPLLLHRQHSGRSIRSGGSKESLELGASAGASGSQHGSQASMAMDLHIPNDCPVTLKVQDQSRKSDTSRKHLLMRQRPVEDEEHAAARDNDEFQRDSHSCSPRLPGDYTRSSTIESWKVVHPRSRCSTGDSRYYHSRRSSTALFMRANTEDSRHPPSASRSRLNITGEPKRVQQQRRESISHGSMKLNYSKSNTDDYRRRRESISSDLNRRRRESASKIIYSRSNTEECRSYHPLPSPHDVSPYTISRSEAGCAPVNLSNCDTPYLQSDVEERGFRELNVRATRKGDVTKSAASTGVHIGTTKIYSTNLQESCESADTTVSKLTISQASSQERQQEFSSNTDIIEADQEEM